MSQKYVSRIRLASSFAVCPLPLSLMQFFLPNFASIDVIEKIYAPRNGVDLKLFIMSSH